MAKPIIELTRGVPTTDKGWLDVFARINKYLRIVGDQLQIGGEIQLPSLSVGTAELKADSVTNDKLRDSAALSLMGQPSDTGGNPSDIIATVADTFMVRRGSALIWDVLEDADIPVSVARGTDVSDAIAAHEAEPDPHPLYALDSELATRPQQTTGTFTATLTGCTTSPTETVRYVITGQTVALYIPLVFGTSNSTSCTLTGAPVGIRPTRDQGYTPVLVQDNATLIIGLGRMLTTGVIELRPGSPYSATGWTNSGTKGVDHANLVYNID